MKKKQIVAAALGAAMAAALAACGESPNARGGDDALVLAAVPAEASEELEASFEPVVAALEHELGREVTFEAVSSNSGVIEAQVSERVDIAVYGAFSYFLASTRADVTPVAVDVLGPGMDPGVPAYGVVPAGSDITSLGDAAGADVCFTDPASTTGYLAPAAGLIEAGVDPEADVSPTYAGGHDTALSSMLAGDCDLAFAAATFVDVLLPARGELDPDEVEVVWESSVVPGPPFVVGNWLDEELRTQITDALTSYDAVSAAEAGFCEGAEQPAPEPWGDVAGEPSCMWGGTGAYAFVPTDDAAYDPIREICEVTEAEVCTEGD
ncbi:phosphate/phosphite/phosphonate ABC transporter substrate-binding protein [Georgenia alba]|uniref:Phosphate/phosphite/phosphonate ABC transporter substrate-binding protein n=1 Tax=Georgenia alba TaxID=2233858 RepID=A0ABW2Q9A1_9MICO